MVNDLHEVEIELAELKGFNRALAIFSVISWVLIAFIVGDIFLQINSIPNKTANVVQSVLNKYQVNIN